MPFILVLIMTPAFLRNMPSPIFVPEDGRNFPLCHMMSPFRSPAFSFWKLTFPYLRFRRLRAGRNISLSMATAVWAGLSRNCGSFPGRSKIFCSFPEIQHYFLDSPGPVSFYRGKFARGLSHRARLRLMPRY